MLQGELYLQDMLQGELYLYILRTSFKCHVEYKASLHHCICSHGGTEIF
jgi:hypothetical protein